MIIKNEIIDHGEDKIEKNRKIIGIWTIFVILIVGAILTVSYSFSNDILLDVKLDGENVTVGSLAIPFGKNIGSMENEITDYSLKEMNNVNTNISTFKSGITKIAEKYGFTNINVDVTSQFGKDKLPMIVIVDGTSMVPTLGDGEEVIIEKTKNIKVGDIVVAKDPEYGLLIKRVGTISGNRIFLSADNNNTVNIFENGVHYQMKAVEKWTNVSNIVGVAKIFDIGQIKK